MEIIENLLNQVAIVNKKNTEILDATGGRFNIFRLCGVNHSSETVHSAIIAEFLDPQGSHGLKSKLLECFIETIPNRPDSFDCKNAKVIPEHTTSEGNIDISIEDGSGKCIIIENKFYAPDQPQQLIRYDNYAKRIYGEDKYRIIYLTPDGRGASEQSCGKIGCERISYDRISYETQIIEWLEKCVAIAADSPIVHGTIIQYINHLKQLTNQDMDTKNKEEIIEILSNIENMKAAKTIYQNYCATFDSLAAKYFNPKIVQFVKELDNENKIGLEYHYEGSEERYINFSLTSPKWPKSCSISFVYDSKCYYCGVFYPEISEENKNNIIAHLKKRGISHYSKNPSYPVMIKLQDLELADWEKIIKNDSGFFNDYKEKITLLLEAMKGINL